MGDVYNTITIGSNQPIDVISAGDPGTLLVNLDVNNTIYLGVNSGVSAINPVNIPLEPLGSVTLDGSLGGVWAVCAIGQTAQIAIAPGGIAFSSSPVLIAEQIAISGINSPVPALIQGRQAVAAANSSFGPLTFTFPTGGAFELVFTQTVQLNACVADILVQHQDIQGNIIYTEQFTVAVGSIGNFSPVIYRGNLQTNRIIVSGTTISQAALTALPIDTGPFTVTGLSMAVYSIGQSFASTSPKMIPSNTTEGVLQSFQATSLGAGASSVRVPVFSYVGSFKWDTFSAIIGNARASISFFTVAAGTTPQGVFRMQNDTTVSNIQEWVMQGMLGVMQVTNEGTATASITTHAIIKDYI